MIWGRIFAGLMLSIGLGGVVHAAPEAASEDLAQIAVGHDIAQKNCAACHAIGAQGVSPKKSAPAFRVLSRNYPLDNLEEALAEGISVGHSEMPQFEFDADQSDALIAYLRSIQVKPAGNQ